MRQPRSRTPRPLRRLARVNRKSRPTPNHSLQTLCSSTSGGRLALKKRLSAPELRIASKSSRSLLLNKITHRPAPLAAQPGPWSNGAPIRDDGILVIGCRRAGRGGSNLVVHRPVPPKYIILRLKGSLSPSKRLSRSSSLLSSMIDRDPSIPPNFACEGARP